MRACVVRSTLPNFRFRFRFRYPFLVSDSVSVSVISVKSTCPMEPTSYHSEVHVSAGIEKNPVIHKHTHVNRNSYGRCAFVINHPALTRA